MKLFPPPPSRPQPSPLSLQVCSEEQKFNTRRTLSLLASLTPTYKPFCLQLVELEKKETLLEYYLDMNPLSLLRDGSPVIVGETITQMAT
jgi:hypothetical protein